MAIDDIQDIPNPGQDKNILTCWKNWKKLKTTLLEYVTLSPDSSTRNRIQPTNAAYTPLVIRGAASQSANLLVIENSAGTSLFSIGSGGNTAIAGTLDVAGTTTTKTITSQATSAGTQVVTTIKNNAGSVIFELGKSSEYGIQNIYDNASTSLIQLYANSAGLSYINAGNVSIGNATDNGFKLDVTGTARISSTIAHGTQAVTTTTAYNLSTGIPFTTSSQTGILSQPVFTSSATTFGMAIGAQVGTPNSAFTMANAYGVYIYNANKGAASTITNLIGLNIADQTAGGTNYAIKTGAGIVSIGDTTDAGSLTTGALIVAGGLAVTKRLTIDGSTTKTLRLTNAVANAAVAVTLGLGPTGSTAGTPQGWMRVDVAGTDRYMPFW